MSKHAACRSYDDAERSMEDSSNGCPCHLHVVTSYDVKSTIELIRFTHTDDHIAIGVFYTNGVVTASGENIPGSSYDFWGFVAGNFIRSRCGAGDSITIDRAWCTVDLDGCHESYDMYKGFDMPVYVNAGEETSIELFHQCMVVRLAMYEVASGKGRDVNSFSLWQKDVLRIAGADAARDDRTSYAIVAMFICNKQHTMSNRGESTAFIKAWHVMEKKLFAYRLAYTTTANISALIDVIGYRTQIKRVASDDICATVMDAMRADTDANAADREAYASSLRDFLPPGTHRYSVPFEMAISLIAAQKVFVSGGFAYITEFDLYDVLSIGFNQISIDNITRMANASTGREEWVTDQRTSAVYREFVGRYKVTLALHGFTIQSTQRSKEPKVDDAVHRDRLASVMSASPACITPMMDRAVNLAVRDHNKLGDRTALTEFALRMRVPMHILKPLLKAKVDISYQEPRAWVGIEKSIDFDEKRFNNPKPGWTTFVPSCKWIVNSSRSQIQCPYANKLQTNSPASRQWGPDELSSASRAMCQSAWRATARSVGSHTYPASSPDEYTERMIAHKEKEAEPQVKRKA